MDYTLDIKVKDEEAEAKINRVVESMDDGTRSAKLFQKALVGAFAAAASGAAALGVSLTKTMAKVALPATASKFLLEMATRTGGIVAFVKSTRAANEIQKVATETDLSTEAIQRFGLAAQATKGDIGSFISAAQHIKKLQEDLAGGSDSAAKTFKAVGISARDAGAMSPEDIIFKLFKGVNMGAMTPDETSNLSAVLGGTGLIPSLQKGASSADALAKAFGNVNVVAPGTIKALSEIAVRAENFFQLLKTTGKATGPMLTGALKNLVLSAAGGLVSLTTLATAEGTNLLGLMMPKGSNARESMLDTSEELHLQRLAQYDPSLAGSDPEYKQLLIKQEAAKARREKRDKQKEKEDAAYEKFLDEMDRDEDKDNARKQGELKRQATRNVHGIIDATYESFDYDRKKKFLSGRDKALRKALKTESDPEKQQNLLAELVVNARRINELKPEEKTFKSTADSLQKGYGLSSGGMDKWGPREEHKIHNMAPFSSYGGVQTHHLIESKQVNQATLKELQAMNKSIQQISRFMEQFDL